MRDRRSGVVGRWFVTPHAVLRYIERIRPGLSYDEALADLIRFSLVSKKKAILPRRSGESEKFTTWLWRGPRPLRLRFRVVENDRDLPQLVTVFAGHDGPKRTLGAS